MKKLLTALMTACLLFTCPALLLAGDTTTNGYYYLPSYGATGSGERTSWFNSLEATDGIIHGIRGATYITQTSSGTLTGEQVLSVLSTGLLKVTTGTGVLSTAVAGTDYEPAISSSSDIAGTISDETGTGSAVFGTSPTITTPVLLGAMGFPDGVRQSFNPDSTTPGLNIGSVAGDPSSPSNGDMWYDSSGGKFRCYEAGTAKDCIGAGGGGGGSGTVNTGVSGYFSYYPSNGTTVDDQTALFLSGSSVGVGTTSPVGALNVVGDEARIGSGGTNTNATAAGELYVQGDAEVDGTVYAGTLNENGNSVPNNNEIDDSSELASLVTDETGTGALVFGTTPTFTTNITAPLILGGSAVGSSVEIRSTSGVGTTSNIKFTVGNNGATEAMRILNNGNVGIGTTTPSTVLQVVGGAPRFNSLANCDTIDTDANGVLACGSDAGGANGFTDDGTTVRLATSTDGLAVGTATEAGKFTVDGDTDEIQLAVQGNATQTSDVVAITKSDNTRFFTIENSGNVGVGTANPQAFFTVGPTGSFTVDNAGAIGAASITLGGTGLSALNQGLVVNEAGGATANDILRVEGDTDTLLLISDPANDRIGIGTSTVGAKLTIEQTAAADSFRVNDSAADTTPFVINQAGNVGVGTTAPSTNLHVVGGARITGLASCDTIDTDSNGVLSCGTDGGGGSGGPSYWERTLLPQGAVMDDNSPPDLSVVESSGTGTSRRYVLDFDPSTDQIVYWSFIVPTDLAAGNWLLDTLWYSNDTGANEDAIWAAQMSCTTEADTDSMAEDAAGSANTASENVNATEANRLMSTTITLSNLDSVAAGDFCTIRFFRDADDSVGDADNDGLTSDARLLGVRLKVPRS